ncbi:hypothetical protein PG996_003013 [Apiospora saccharicola]|uniref:Uncharacterized protein n=1 Tax=Apiospora saccharicola TaxID=335842 RepID=A0ABR1W053_9PEZI
MATDLFGPADPNAAKAAAETDPATLTLRLLTRKSLGQAAGNYPANANAFRGAIAYITNRDFQSTDDFEDEPEEERRATWAVFGYMFLENRGVEDLPMIASPTKRHTSQPRLFMPHIHRAIGKLTAFRNF